MDSERFEPEQHRILQLSQRKRGRQPLLLFALMVIVLVRFIPLPGQQMFTYHTYIDAWLTSAALEGNVTRDAIASTPSDKQTGAASEKPGVAIFYNIYVNPNESDNGIRIITEQTKQILQRWTTQQDEQSDQSTSLPPLYYNMIGLNHTAPFCPSNMTCRLIKHYEQAFEEVTLQSLYDYCRQNPRDKVFYLHNKGSFTKTPANEKWRREETDFLFGNKTIALMANHNRTCNVVGRVWEPYPWWHFQGNFWQAKCSYVRRLIPPINFTKVRSKFIQQRILHPSNSDPKSPLFCLTSFFKRGKATNINEFKSRFRMQLGLDRYGNEHWISSHPDVVPCDPRDSAFTTHMLNFKTSTTKREWGQKGMQYKHEWFRLNGRLFELYHLFGQLPPNSSFFWRYYARTEQPLEPELCKEGRGRNLSAYFRNGNAWSSAT